MIASMLGGLVKKGISLFLVSFLVWFFFTGSLSWQELSVGAVVSIIITLVTKEYFNFNILKLDLPLRIIKYVALYLPLLIFEMIKANIHMALIVLNPKLPLNSGIVKNKTKLKNEVSKLILANSITLTPGTLTVDVDEENLYIHSVDINTVEDEKSITSKFDKTIKGVFE